MPQPKLQILIATFEVQGLQRLVSVNLPFMEGVEYLVSCQNPSGSPIEIPPALMRPDIKIEFSQSKGLSRNRNILLDRATAAYCLIADDDLVYSESGVRKVIETFDNNPEVDFATFAYTIPGGGTEKPYPSCSFDLKKPAKGYFLTSFEIAFRNEALKEKDIKFNENFGIGAPEFGCGEEDIWVYNLLKNGLHGNFYPIFIAEHQGSTTGIRNAARPEVLRAQGVIIRKFHPRTSLLRVLLKGYRSCKATNKSFFYCIRFLFEGWIKNIKL